MIPPARRISSNSVSQALASVQEIIALEERYAVPVEIPTLCEAARERLDGELPKLFAVDPEKLKPVTS